MLKTSQSARVVAAARSSATTEGSKPGAGCKAAANQGASSSSPSAAGSSAATPASPEYVPVSVQASGGWTLDWSDSWGVVLQTQMEGRCSEDYNVFTKNNQLIDPFSIVPDKSDFPLRFIPKAQASAEMVVEPSSIAEPTLLVAPAQPEDLEPFPCDEDNDVQLVAEYAHGIFEVLFEEEVLTLPNPNYIEIQTDINARMRGILVDWLVEVHTKYRLRQQVLFLTVNLIDRYLSVGPIVSRRKLQLVGVAAMFIAAKFEEIDPPQVKDFVYITDNAYTKEEVLQAECSMLGTLGFHVVVPTADEFLERLCRAHCCDSRHRSLAQYILELALVDVRSLQYRPSHLAAASLLLSNELLGERVAWPSSLARCARYTEQSLRPCISELRAIHQAAQGHSLQAVRKKFQLRQNNCVATLCTQAQSAHQA